MATEYTERQRRNFIKKVRVTDECWLWTGAIETGDYGCFLVNGTAQRAHRVAWELAYGEIPTGLHVCHRCDVRLCVNPWHMFLGTNAENMADRNRKGRQAHSRGELSGNAKLTTEDVLQIRKLHRAGGLTLKEIAEPLGICASHVLRIAKGKSWEHLNGN